MIDFFRPLIRSSAFIRKEIQDVLRQPRLIITLILGPFLILLIFGLGYRNHVRPLRTLFVAQPNNTFAQNIHQYEKSVSSTLIYSGTIADQTEAINRLKSGSVDIVIVVPTDAYETVLRNQQAVFTMYYTEIDPIQISYLEYIGIFFSDVVNREVLRTLAEHAQQDSADLHNNLQTTHQNLEKFRQAVNKGDATSAQLYLGKINNNIDAIILGVGASSELLNSIKQTNGAEDEDAVQPQSFIQKLQQDSADLSKIPATTDQRLSKIDKMDKDIKELDSFLVKYQSIDSYIIVNPFHTNTRNIANIHPTQSDFFTPAVLALLLQHLAVTFAALSIVRERTSGAMELFRISPLSAGEALTGKYLSYMTFGLIIAAVLSAMLIFILHLPMMGNWFYFALVIAAILFTSLGIGFFISIISQTDTQAVQFGMIVLLTSVFFGGFIINLDFLSPPVRVISWLLPSTYGTTLLRDILLRGNPPSALLMSGLVAIGMILFLVSMILLRRHIATK